MRSSLSRAAVGLLVQFATLMIAVYTLLISGRY
jgi:hypothetical protein